MPCFSAMLSSVRASLVRMGETPHHRTLAHRRICIWARPVCARTIRKRRPHAWASLPGAFRALPADLLHGSQRDCHRKPSSRFASSRAARLRNTAPGRRTRRSRRFDWTFAHLLPRTRRGLPTRSFRGGFGVHAQRRCRCPYLGNLGIVGVQMGKGWCNHAGKNAMRSSVLYLRRSSIERTIPPQFDTRETVVVNIGHDQMPISSICAGEHHMGLPAGAV